MIKSQDELNTCNNGNRGSEVLLATIEKCEKLQKYLDNAERILNELSIGHQSRNKYNELIRMGKAYFKEKKMTDLTEKWKKGELESGLYYVGNSEVKDIAKARNR